MATGIKWGKIIATRDGGFAATAATVHRESAFLIKFNQNLDVEFIKEYPDTVNRSNFDYSLFETDSGYILYGTIQRPNYKISTFVRRVDLEGNTVWFRFVDENYEESNFWHGEAINDSTYLFLGNTILGWGILSGYADMLMLKGNGEVLKKKQFLVDQTAKLPYFYWGTPTEDGGVITYGMVVFPSPFTNQIGQGAFAKFDSNLNHVWTRTFGRNPVTANSYVFLNKFAKRNGYYVAAGRDPIEPPTVPNARMGGWVQKFTLEGDSIWSRRLLAPVPNDLDWNPHAFYAVDVLSSGSVIAAGTAIAGGPKGYLWLAKLTPDGCMDTLFCEEIILSDKGLPRPGNQQRFKVFPNPAADFVQIELPEAVPGAGVRVFDAQGRLAFSQNGSPAATQIKVDVRGIPPGFYLLEILSNGKAVGREKLVVGQ